MGRAGFALHLELSWVSSGSQLRLAAPMESNRSCCQKSMRTILEVMRISEESQANLDATQGLRVSYLLPTELRYRKGPEVLLT